MPARRVSSSPGLAAACTSRIYGAFVYGLNRLEDLLVYTSSGAGTWAPLRVGTNPEIVLFKFE